MNKAVGTISGFLAVSALVAGCGTSGSNGGSSNGGKVTLNFLQNKTEAVGEFNTLIKEFEKENPNITVTQINPPNADTVLQTDLTKNQLPDVISMGADSTYVEMATSGVLKDFSSSSELKNVNSTYADMLEKETGKTTPYGIPFTVNAQPILYNKTLFKKYGLTVPTTWNELVADAQKVKAAGGTPFEFGFKDAWTLMVPWNSLAGNIQDANFNADIKAGKTSFTQAYPQVASRLLQLASYGENGEMGVSYNDANAAFGNGKAVFYAQGDWAVPAILQANPNAQIGSFAFPAADNATENKLVSGVDSVLTISANSPNQAAAQKFIDFLMEKKNAQAYCDNQKLFSAVDGVNQSDPAVANLSSYMKDGKVVDYPDHYYPQSMDANVANMIQGFMSTKNVPKFLGQLDSAYKKAAAQQ